MVFRRVPFSALLPADRHATMPLCRRATTSGVPCEARMWKYVVSYLFALFSFLASHFLANNHRRMFCRHEAHYDQKQQKQQKQPPSGNLAIWQSRGRGEMALRRRPVRPGQAMLFDSLELERPQGPQGAANVPTNGPTVLPPLSPRLPALLQRPS